MPEQYYNRARKPGKKSVFRLLIIFSLLAVTIVLAVFGSFQYLSVQLLRGELQQLEDRYTGLEEELLRIRALNEELQRDYERIKEDNETLREENHMLRTSAVISHGNRETNRVAITIDDGNRAELVHLTLDYLAEHDVRATLFPMGSWVERTPEAWQRAVEEGHELGNHTYSHAFLTTLSEEGVRNELQGWQDSVDSTLGYPYSTYYFRPPGMDGFTNPQGSTAQRLQTIIAEKGMFTVLWDVELVYALRNEVSTPARITEHVLANARGGSIVLLHFTENDIAALPAIISGLRARGLEPCSLRELLLADM